MSIINYATGTADGHAADAAVFLFERTTNTPSLLVADGLVTDQTREALEAAVAAIAKVAPVSEPALLPGVPGLGSPVAIVAQVSEASDPESVRRAVGGAIRAAGSSSRVVVAASSTDPEMLQAIGEGAQLGGYRFDRFRSESGGTGESGESGAADAKHDQQREISIAIPAEPTGAQLVALERAAAVADSVAVARDLVNTPPNELFPAALADFAREYLSDSPVAVKIWKSRDLRRGGYGGLLGVGRGSRRGPRLIRLRYQPQDPVAHIALVGKGITFDSGGLSLKPAKSMETMKSDMGGAAAVLATLRAVADLGLPVAVTGWLASAENMPGGTAQRPGDVITIRGGRTVEVLNTDAEGRLVLADALVRAGEDSPDVIIDVATLTGAQMVALGARVCGVMGNDPALRDSIVAAADTAGEGAWPMPLPGHLHDSLKSPVADLANIGDRNGGMLTAALFLQDFVTEGTSWSHMDIAGPAWNSGAPHGYTPRGGTGFAVRTLTQFLTDRATSEDDPADL